jgi:hypothetical protein
VTTVELTITGAEEVAKRIEALTKQSRSYLLTALRIEGEALLYQARSSYSSVGIQRRTGAMLASLSYKAWAGKASVGVRVATDKTAFYSGWIEHGLPLRPRGERAKSRRLGIVNKYLGRARDEQHKPWGIKARPFLQHALDARRSHLEAAAIAAVEKATDDFNTGAGGK